MGNMSYCRFQNTLQDLRYCVEAMDEPQELSSDETDARLRIIRLAKQITEDYGNEVAA